jgi:hypothetical protein
VASLDENTVSGGILVPPLPTVEEQRLKDRLRLPPSLLALPSHEIQSLDFRSRLA